MSPDDFDFSLPEGAIARHPTARRDGSRLLVLDRATGDRAHHHFSDLPELLDPGDLVVVNDARVLRARLRATKPTGGKVELLLVEPAPDHGEHAWRAMARPAKALRIGMPLVLEADRPPAVVREPAQDGFVVVALPEPAEAIAARIGELPLPPYLERSAEAEDEDRYQTVYARASATRSVAAPTAGLHFTPDLLARLDARGIGRASVTLHVGPGTFLPVRADRLEDHVMHEERFELPAETADRIRATRAAGRRVVAIGTTVTRVLESRGPGLEPGPGATRLFIRPGFDFSVVGGLVTNFHLPRSTLLMLVCAFGGQDRVLAAYRAAVEASYRFYSYGDAMLLR